jgi:hypothetical protein
MVFTVLLTNKWCVRVYLMSRKIWGNGWCMTDRNNFVIEDQWSIDVILEVSGIFTWRTWKIWPFLCKEVQIRELDNENVMYITIQQGAGNVVWHLNSLTLCTFHRTRQNSTPCYVSGTGWVPIFRHTSSVIYTVTNTRVLSLFQILSSSCIAQGT